MESTIKMLEDHTSWKESMRKCCRNNKLNIEIVAFYTPLRFRTAYSKFKAMYTYIHEAMRKRVHKRMKGGYKTN